MRKRKLCVIWIWYLLFDNARFQRWLARQRRHGWELAHVGFLFFRFERSDGTRYRYYMQMMRDDPDTERGRTYLAGVEELGVTCLGCFWHRAFFRWEDDGRPVEMFSDLASRALEAKCVRSAQLAAAVWCAVNAALLFFRAWLDLDAARGFDELCRPDRRRRAEHCGGVDAEDRDVRRVWPFVARTYRVGCARGCAHAPEMARAQRRTAHP